MPISDKSEIGCAPRNDGAKKEITGRDGPVMSDRQNIR
jgi:hypothetical protein